MNDINLNSFKIFLEVANSNSFLEASNKLFLSQPAISKSMSKLEEDLGISLFYRANKGISLTPSGEVLYKYLKDTKDLLLSCQRLLVSMNDIEEANLIIGVQSHIQTDSNINLNIDGYNLAFINCIHFPDPNLKSLQRDMEILDSHSILTKKIVL